MTPRAYREYEQIYAGEIERGVDGDVLAEIGFRPLGNVPESPTDMPVEGVVSEVAETVAVDEGSLSPEAEDTAAAPDDMAWQHEAYVEYLAQQEPEKSPRAAKSRRRRGSTRRLTGRAALFAEGRGTDPDLR